MSPSSSRSLPIRPAASSPDWRQRPSSTTARSTSPATTRASSRSMPVPARSAWYWEPKYEDGARGGAVLRAGQPRPGDPGRSGLRRHARRAARGARTSRTAPSPGSRSWRTGRRPIPSTGAPLVVGDLVIAGIGGAEYGVRGFVQAFKAATGEPALEDLHDPRPRRARQRDLARRHLEDRRCLHLADRRLRRRDQARCSGAPAIPGPGTPTCARATTSGPARWSRWTSRPARSSGPSSTRRTTPGTMTATTRPRCSTSPSTASRARSRYSRNRNGFLYVLDRVTGEFIYATPTIEGINWTTGTRPHDRHGRRSTRPAPEERRRQGRDDHSRARRRHQLVPDRRQPREGHRLPQHQRLGHVAQGVEARGRRSTMPGNLYMGVDYQMYRHKEQTGYLKAFDVANKKWLWETASAAADVRGRAGDQGRAAVHRRPARLLRGARRRRPARSCGSSRPAPASTPRRSPTSSTACSTSRSCPAWAAIPASTSRAPRAACSGCSRSTARWRTPPASIPPSSRRRLPVYGKPNRRPASARPCGGGADRDRRRGAAPSRRTRH